MGQVLSALWKKASTVELISGASIENSHEDLTHLQFVDGTILFASADVDKLINLRILLRLLEAVTGLKLNLLKCELVRINIQEADKQLIAHILGVNLGTFLIKYLGLPLTCGLWQPQIFGLECHYQKSWRLYCFLEGQIAFSWGQVGTVQNSEHLFLECGIITTVWSQFFKTIKFQWTWGNSILDLSMEWRKICPAIEDKEI